MPKLTTAGSIFTMNAYNWPLQNYKLAPTKAKGNYPTDVASADWLKREVVQSVLAGNGSEAAVYEYEDADENVTHEVIELDCEPEDAWMDVETGDIFCSPGDADGAKSASTTAATEVTATANTVPQTGPSLRGSVPTQRPSNYH